MKSLSFLAILAAFCPASHANVILLDSGPGLNTSLGGTTVAVTPDPLWQQNNPTNPGDPLDTSAVWISNSLSGWGDSQFQPSGGTTPVVTIYQDFTSGTGNLSMNVWADDTADVILDGTYLAHAVFTQSICSGQPIGCRPQDDAALTAPLLAGNHSLEFTLYQVGTGTDTTSNPFGLLYTGTAPVPDPVPEPTAYIPLLTVMTGLGIRAWRKKPAA